MQRMLCNILLRHDATITAAWMTNVAALLGMGPVLLYSWRFYDRPNCLVARCECNV